MNSPLTASTSALSLASPDRTETLLKESTSGNVDSGAFGRKVAICLPENKQLSEEQIQTLKYGKILSKTHYTTVRQVTISNNDSELKKLEPLVVKQMISHDSDDEKYADEEIAIHLSLDHENIVKAFGYFAACSLRTLVMKHYNHTLSSMLARYVPVGDSNQRLTMIQDIFNGLDYLHKKDIIHADLAPKNIFQDENKRMVIGDFGLSNQEADAGTVIEGSYYYLAPELSVPYCEKVSKEADCFSAGGVSLAIVLSKTVHNLWAKKGSKLNEDSFKINFSSYLRQHPPACVGKDKSEVMLTDLFNNAEELITLHGNKIAHKDKEVSADVLKHLVFPLLKRDPKMRINIQEAIAALNSAFDKLAEKNEALP